MEFNKLVPSGKTRFLIANLEKKIARIDYLINSVHSLLPESSCELLEYILKDADGDGEDDLISVFGKNNTIIKRDYSDIYFSILKINGDKNIPVVRKIDTGKHYSNYSLLAMDLNSVKGNEAILKLFNIDEPEISYLIIVGIDKFHKLDKLLAFETCNGIRDLPDIEDINRDKIHEIIRYREYRLKTGTIVLPLVYTWFDNKFQFVDHGFEDYYNNFFQSLKKRKKKSFNLNIFDNELNYLLFVSGKLSANYKESEVFINSIISSIGKPDAENSSIIKELHREKRKLRQFKRKAVTGFKEIIYKK